MTTSSINRESPEWTKILEFLNLWITLVADARKLDVLDVDNKQPFRRAYVRAVLAFVEGLVFGLKDQALQKPAIALSRAEEALLLEEAFELDERGKPRTKKSFLRLETNIRFAFATYAKSAGAEYEIPTGEAGWGLLIEAIRIRNRLAHPRSLSDLSVSDEEKARVRQALEWFEQKHRDMLRVIMVASFRRAGLGDDEIEKALSEAPFSF